MIGTIDIRVQAAKPNFPLEKIRAFVNSPSSLRLRNVPREIGKWEITEVFVSANYPDNSIPSVKAVETAGIYVATLPASSVAGLSVNGYTVTANGIDENGEAVEGYILGKGDLEIINADGTITVGETTYYIHIVPTKSAKPHKGDFALDTQELYDGEKWISLGGGSGSVEWNAILNKPNFKAVATSGSYNDLVDKPTLPEGAIVLTLNGQRIFKNGTEEITTYSALLALVKAGGVVLLDTVAGTIAKEALFHPHMADETAIRFDATGTLGEKVYTRSFAFTPKTDGGIAVSRGDLTEVAKKSDIPTSMPWGNVTNKPSVFPPESHSHESTEIKVKDGKNELPLVVDPSSYAKTGQAADAFAIGYAFPAFFGNGNDDFSIYYSEGYLIFNSPNLGLFKVKIGNNDTELADITKLSGITSQDITDFLNYKGDTNDYDSGSVFVKGDVVFDNFRWFSPIGFYRAKADDVSLRSQSNWEFIYAKNEGKTGLERLIDLFGESNSQLKATIRGQFKAGDNVSITEDTDGKMKISATGGGGEIPDYTLAWNPDLGQPGYYTKD